MKNLIILAIFIVIFAISAIFYQKINSFTYKFMLNNKIVTRHNNLLVHFISVGQGDAVAINLPSGKTLLIDAGPMSSNVDYTNYLKDKVLNNSTTKKIDYLVLTHADADHVGGTLKLLDCFDVDKIFLPKVETSTETYLDIKDSVAGHNCETISETLEIDDNDIKFSCFLYEDAEDANNSCPVIKIEYLNKSFLFAGDVSYEAEKELIYEYGHNLNADVLKVAHHGSKDSTSTEFISQVTPEYAVISVGENGYGHPNEETLERLERENIEVLRTDEQGNILFVVGDYYNLSSIKGEYAVTNLSFDYRIFVIIVEFAFITMVVFIVVKNLKQSPNK